MKHSNMSIFIDMTTTDHSMPSKNDLVSFGLVQFVGWMLTRRVNYVAQQEIYISELSTQYI